MYPVLYGNTINYICSDKLSLDATFLSCITNLIGEKSSYMVLFSFYFPPQEL